MKLKSAYKFLMGPLKTYGKDRNFRRNARYASYIEKYAIDDKMIVYEAFHGKGLVCNPYAIFKYLVNHEDYKDYTHVWAVNNLEADFIKEYSHLKNVKFVRIYGRDYLKAISRAKYLINNVTFPIYFQKREGQVYINTWHGTPLKHLGNDENTAAMDAAKNMIRNMMCCDYFLNQNKFSTDAMKSAFELEDIYKGEFIEEGYPRTDIILNTDTEVMKEKLRKIGIHINKKVVLYAPTWRGTVQKVENNTSRLAEDIKRLKEMVGDEYDILLKLHQLEYKYVDAINEEGIYSIPVEWDANEILSITDILITDYSSIYFDYLVTGKPILFYMYDKERYIDTRGTYIAVTEENMPGPILRNIEEVTNAIKEIEVVKERYAEQYAQAVKQYCAKQDGQVTKRIIDYIFNKQGQVATHKCYAAHKKHILVYGGGFLNNGITTSLLNILNAIDYDKYTVTVVEADKADSRRANLMKLNPNVKIMFRAGQMNCRFLEAYSNKWILRTGVDNAISKKIYPKKLYQREYRRLLGDLDFDIMLDFNGYVPFWDLVFLNSGSKAKKYIYQHNSMLEEYDKIINKKYKHRDNLKMIFQLYKSFDKVVSVSKATMALNKENLKTFTNTDNFTYTNNLIDVAYIEDKLANIEEVTVEGEKYLVENMTSQLGRSEMTLLPQMDLSRVNLVTVGRLSPEKDHDKLLDAFEIICRTHDNISLYIIGDGVLKGQLINKIDRLGLQDKVYLLGQVSNPFYYIKNSSAFILPSNHEGQPMVLLEALTLDKKIIATDIVANRGVLEGGLGELVENSIEGVVAGIEKLLRNEILDYSFNIYDYNKAAFELLEKEILN